MEETRDQPGEFLNEHHKRRLLVSCQYMDQLLSDVEAVLNASASKSPFPKYLADISPVQRKVTEDYIARLRAQLVRVLESQGVVHPRPQIGALHAIRTFLNFIEIAAEELKPKYMRGYGEIPPAAMADLNGIAEELEALVRKLGLYLAQGLGQDLQGRLERLEQTSDEIALLKIIERIIMERGLVEFRSALSLIVERLEEDKFEIAFFGRVSAGKSSLLNHVLNAPVLPVGVNPITAVPTRIAYGAAPKLTVSFAQGATQTLAVEKLTEFATEQHNPANAKHVSRLSVELPSPRLQNGVVFVDTPGLGSLASAGAAETIAYLPRCDLGVVLIDAATTLTQEDLTTIQTLYEASIPALVLLSKADLLTPEDQTRAAQYIAAQINSQLGLNLSVQAVSAVGAHAQLSDKWFAQEILPLYDKYQQLARKSLRRKVGSLREAVLAALHMRLERTKDQTPDAKHDVIKLEAELRRAGGGMIEARSTCRKLLDEIPGIGTEALHRAAVETIKEWRATEDATGRAALVSSVITETVAEKAQAIHESLASIAQHLAGALDTTAQALGIKDVPAEGELASVLKEMPRLDLGTLQLEMRFSFLLSLGAEIATRRVEKELHKQIGTKVSVALASYAKLLEAWVAHMFDELGRRFNAEADYYRAQIERLSGNHAGISTEETTALRRDLERLAVSSSHTEPMIHA